MLGSTSAGLLFMLCTKAFKKVTSYLLGKNNGPWNKDFSIDSVFFSGFMIALVPQQKHRGKDALCWKVFTVSVLAGNTATPHREHIEKSCNKKQGCLESVTVCNFTV